MSEVLIQQKEKVNDILQTFANFGNQTQDTILNNEQIKKKETERITYFENYLTEFEKSFSLMEINLRKSLQERENILAKLNAISRAQKNLQENKDTLINSAANNMGLLKYLVENEKNELNWTNYITLIGLIGVKIYKNHVFYKF